MTDTGPLGSQHCLHLLDATATRDAGAALARALCESPAAASLASAPLVITLSGELGAGKTTYVGGLLAALGVTGPVRSPTYTLIEPYELVGTPTDTVAGHQCLHTVYHLDLYRLTDPLQLEDLGIRDLLQPGAVLLVEWAERAGPLWSVPDLAITLRYPDDPADTGRWLSCQAHRESLWPLIDALNCSVG